MRTSTIFMISALVDDGHQIALDLHRRGEIARGQGVARRARLRVGARLRAWVADTRGPRLAFALRIPKLNRHSRERQGGGRSSPPRPLRRITAGAARAWWPIQSSKLAGPGSPRLGRFDSFAASWLSRATRIPSSRPRSMRPAPLSNARSHFRRCTGSWQCCRSRWWRRPSGRSLTPPSTGHSSNRTARSQCPAA